MSNPEVPERIGRSAKRPPVVIVLAMLLFLLATGGFYGAYMLLADISGAKLGVSQSMLDHLPIDTFLLPGIFLLIFMGIVPSITVVGVLRKDIITSFQRFSLLKKYCWAYSYSVFTGAALLCWTIGELILWGANPLSIIYFIWGALILLVCMVPKMKNYYRISDELPGN